MLFCVSVYIQIYKGLEKVETGDQELKYTRAINNRSASHYKASAEGGVPGFRPKKRLGQHFLVDPNIVNKIISHAGFQAPDYVLEIGPGKGALTFPLARSVGHVVAVEKDAYLASLLKDKLYKTGIKNVTVVNHDILTFDFHEIGSSFSIKPQIIGNLPYNISSPFLEKLIENRNLVDRAILMFQVEVAKRITAPPGGKIYGALSLLIQYYAQSTVLFEVPGEAFFPRPKVDSMVVELDFKHPYPRRTADESNFKRVVKAAFAHRRKTLLNSLKSSFTSWDREVILDGMKKCSISSETRAESLDMDSFLCLASVLKDERYFEIDKDI